MMRNLPLHLTLQLQYHKLTMYIKANQAVAQVTASHINKSKIHTREHDLY